MAVQNVHNQAEEGEHEHVDFGWDLHRRFEYHGKLGAGTYGTVYKVKDRITGEVLALKRISIKCRDEAGDLQPAEGVPSTAIREVSILKSCNHPNIIKLHDVLYKHDAHGVPQALFLVFEYVDMDLRTYLKKEHGKFDDRLKLMSAVFQCTSGIDYCHNHRIVHRDLKTQNVLIDVTNGRVKLADFGLARTFTVPLKQYTHEVVTLWYRPPEILLGQMTYSPRVDIWSLACIFGEMATGEAIFRGDSEIDTLFKIMQSLGTPSEQVWKGVDTLPFFTSEFPQWRGDNLEGVLRDGPALGQDGIQLIRSCLKYNPLDRLSASKMLEHKFLVGVNGAAHSASASGAARSAATSAAARGPRVRGRSYCHVCWRSWTLPEPHSGICPTCQVEVAEE
mmetsp:Transcript_8945/g.25694  ORF Transcript_8945/g.25694 Transcript_8945/m.25694 type:complete len:392 (-) Transcript_8945:174-1349(-)